MLKKSFYKIFFFKYNMLIIQYIYIVITREFFNSNQNVYKIGKTGNIIQRLSAYPKGSKLLFTIACNYMTIIEKHIIKISKNYIYKEEI